MRTVYMSTQHIRSNSKSMLMVPASFAPRLRTQPPLPRMAPVRFEMSRAGSSMEVARICRAQLELMLVGAEGRVMGFISPFIGQFAWMLDECPMMRQKWPVAGQWLPGSVVASISR